MPKLKTRKGISKRIRVTRTGKLLRKHAWKSHLLEHKSAKRKRAYRSAQLLDRADAKQARALGGPVARAARSVVLPGYYNQWQSFLPVTLRGLVDAHALSAGLVPRDAALDARYQEIADTHIGKGPSNHDLVIASARAITIEILYRNSPLAQVVTSRRGRLDRAGRADVVGRDRVVEDRKSPCAREFDGRRGCHRAVEIRRLAYVQRSGIPFVQ